MNHRRKEERWLATGTYFNRIKSIITNHYLVVKRYHEYTNKYISIICVYKKLMKITRERLFLFALIAATIIAVVVAPFIVGGT